ncbi:sensor histidine kinase [Balneola sp. MJW-20]|uniref:sensor histidine kinase n=1 Tax=Gracilimonas aurantiaca TaxID=3234185 RepID=UPI00346591C1
MNIRSKLAWTYVILLIIGIITISAYSILTIRSFMLEEGARDFERDTEALALAAGSYSKDGTDFAEKIRKEAEFSGYEIAMYDSSGTRFLAFPDSVFTNEGTEIEPKLKQELDRNPGEPVIYNTENGEKLISYIRLQDPGEKTVYARISQLKSVYYAVVASIRHIIYAGMIFSIGAVIIVSYFVARYISKPILQLNEAALDIARGNLDREIQTTRKDEFGTLAESLNQMAVNLKADNEKLKNLNEKQSQFFADITHEVRNPLHTISGALEMLELRSLDQEKKSQYMKTAQKQIGRINRLFEDIKSLQRYDFDQSFLSKKAFDLSRTIKDAVNAYQPIAQDKGLEIKTEVDGDFIVNADPDKIEQVLDNLISNGIKYTNEGCVKVSVERLYDHVRVSVEDSGIGISREHLSRLFDRFYRTDKARSRDKGGTGLGLSVVKSILNAHNEEIYVESKPGKGSRFYFDLPVSRQSFK